MECPSEWPEPIQRVQSVSESSLSSIPDRYIKPPSQRPQPIKEDSELSIPLIDLSGLDDEHHRAATLREISEACRNWGFFQAVNHGVAGELLDRMRDVWRAFFHLPIQEKEVYANNPKTYEGYGSRLGIEKGAVMDWGDYFFLHVLPPSLKDPNKWPSLPKNCRVSNLFRGTLEEYGGQVMALAGRLLKALSQGLGLRKGFLWDAFGGEVGACMRINYYPKCPQPDLTLGLSSHSDPGGLTVLLPDERVKGLQVRKDDKWITAAPYPHSLIINIGDQIQVISNDAYKSVEHRVVVNSVSERLSVAFFYNPRSDIAIGPAPELVTEARPALYCPMTFDEYRLYIRKRGPLGKSQVESLTAELKGASDARP